MPRLFTPTRIGSSDLWSGAVLAVAALLAFLGARQLHLVSPYWASVTAVIVLGDSPGGSVQAGLLRLMGTLLGVLGGLLVLMLMPQHLLLSTLAGITLGFVACRALGLPWATCKLAGVSTVMLTLAQAHATEAHVLGVGLARSANILLGGLVGVGVGMLVLPRAKAKLEGRSREDIQRVAHFLADVLEARLEGKDTLPDLEDRAAALRAMRNQREQILSEARFEPGANLGPLDRVKAREDALVTSLRHAMVLADQLSDTVAEPWPQPVEDEVRDLISLLRAVGEAQGTAFEGLPERLRQTCLVHCEQAVLDQTLRHRIATLLLPASEAVRALGKVG